MDWAWEQYLDAGGEAETDGVAPDCGG